MSDTSGTGGLLERATTIVNASKYLVLATATPDGTPWVTPVWFAHADLVTFWWVSSPDTRHSRNIAANPAVAITVFDSTVPIGSAAAAYVEARAERCPEPEIDRALAVYSRRSRAHGGQTWDRDLIGPGSRLRLYQARTIALYLLAEDGGPDRRLVVPLPGDTDRTETP